MYTVAFVPARLTSSRLNGKALRYIGERTLLEWVIWQLQQATTIKDIVICAPHEPQSAPLEGVARQHGVHYFGYTGDVNDVVGRLVSAARHVDAEACLLASGDCPLLSAPSIDRLVEALTNEPDAGLAEFSKLNGFSAIHEGIQLVRRYAWERADALSNEPHLREHQFPVLYQPHASLDDIQRISISDEEVYYKVKHRISIDTPADLQFANEVHRILSSQGLPFTLENAVRLWERHPDLLSINANVRQKGLKDSTTSVVLSVDDSMPVSTLINWTDTLTNVHGWGISLATANSELRDELGAQGYHCVAPDTTTSMRELKVSSDAPTCYYHPSMLTPEQKQTLKSLIKH